MKNKIPYKVVIRLGHAIKYHKNALKLDIGANKDINFEPFGKKSIIYLDKGSISLNREKDNVLLFRFEAPFVLGLEQIFFSTECYYISSNSNITLYLLSHEDAIVIFDKDRLWKNVSQWMGYFISIYAHRSHNLAENRCAYDIIKVHLEMIWELPEAEREKTSIFDYILKRHKISRSSIAKIIKELNNSNYITTRRGVLVNFNKLPPKF